MPKIQILVLQFQNDIPQNDIPKFRGAVIASLKQNNILFHNHDENGFVYRVGFGTATRINNYKQ